MYTNVLIYEFNLIQQGTMTVTTSFDLNSSRNSKGLPVFAFLVDRSLSQTVLFEPSWTVQFKPRPLTLGVALDSRWPNFWFAGQAVHPGLRFYILTGPFLVQSAFQKNQWPIYFEKIGNIHRETIVIKMAAVLSC